jgi:hypothetical protein
MNSLFGLPRRFSARCRSGLEVGCKKGREVQCVITLLSIGVLLLLSACIDNAATSRANGPNTASRSSEVDAAMATEMVVVRGRTSAGVYHAIFDAATGAIVPTLDAAEIRTASAALGGAAGIIYLSVPTATGRTEVFGLDTVTGEREVIGSIDGRGHVGSIAVDGGRLWMAVTPDQRQIPSALVAIVIPPRWRPSSIPSLAATRQLLDGIVSQDGRYWYRLSGSGDRHILEIVEFEGGRPVTNVSVPIPSEYNYFSLLAAPDQRTLYVVDYRAAMTVHVIDVPQRTILRSVATWRGGGTKGRSCSAALSPQGDRLYVIGLDGPHGGGIDVIDTASLAVLAHLLAERPVSCLATSPDGQSLYATLATRPGTVALTTIDTETGMELRTVEVAGEETLIPLFASVGRARRR